jgi:hypothetical protein
MGWWRYSRYEILQQRICPCPGASLEPYDLWDEYERSLTRAGESPPYISLLNLLGDIRSEVVFEREKRRLPPSPTDPRLSRHLLDLPFDRSVMEYGIPVLRSINERALKRVLEWTGHYGLLGILRQRVLMAQSPSYDTAQVHFRSNYSRMAGKFFETLAAVPRAEAGKEPTCISFAKTMAPLTIVSPVAKVLADFDLGASPKPWRWPFDLSCEKQFWERYCEPLADWFAEAEGLCRMFKDLSSKQPVTMNFPCPDLNLLLASTGYHLEFNGQGVRRELCYPSLLAAFTAMFAQDLVGQEKRFVTCPGCGATAVSASYRRTYCSKRCAWRARKQRQRSKEA